jgi:hypothetical protein
VFATASANTFSYESASNTLQKTIDLSSSQQFLLSSDGSVLATLDNGPGPGNVSVNIYAMPAGTLIHSFPYSTAGVYPGSITLSGGGTVLGELPVSNTCGGPCSTGSQTVPITGGAVTSFPNAGAIQLSPDGTLAAVSSESLAAIFNSITIFVEATTSIFQNGTLVTTLSGYPVGWLDNGRLLVNNYNFCGAGPLLTEVCYFGAQIYSPTGALLFTPSIPEIESIQVVSSDLVYSMTSGGGQYNSDDAAPITIYSLTTSAPNTQTEPVISASPSVWASADPCGNPCRDVFAGSEIVFVSGNLVIAQPY